MSIESWSPDKSPEQTISLETLKTLSECFDENEGTLLSEQAPFAELINHHAWVMKKDKAFWQPLLETLEPDVLVKLLGFFTLIEEQNQAWAAGSTNPVIYIFKFLRKSKSELINKEKIAWIKANTQNRFLPYGPVL
jgi:hypothetical protein